MKLLKCKYDTCLLIPKFRLIFLCLLPVQTICNTIGKLFNCQKIMFRNGQDIKIYGPMIRIHLLKSFSNFQICIITWKKKWYRIFSHDQTLDLSFLWYKYLSSFSMNVSEILIIPYNYVFFLIVNNWIKCFKFEFWILIWGQLRQCCTVTHRGFKSLLNKAASKPFDRGKRNVSIHPSLWQQIYCPFS